MALHGVKDKVTGKVLHVGTKEECDEEVNRIELVSVFRESYDLIKPILEKYLDLDERYYNIIALWILGTYIHNKFETYPYLFFNAMRGSGKSRTLKLVCSLSKDGNVMASPTEAVLFRVEGTLGIDEFEGVGGKDKSSIRELLNASYKKGTKIFRMKKKKSLAGEELVAEEFEPYRPITMANIWGMEEVLGDRCITLILEKSDNPVKIRLVEDFDNEESFKKTKELLEKCRVCSVELSKNIYSSWNNYIVERYNYTHTTHYTHNTHTTHTTLLNISLDNLFNKIHDSNIKGRNLELFLPLFFIAHSISEEVLEETIKTAQDITMERKHEEEIESLDVMLIDFISKFEPGIRYYSAKMILNQFKEFADIGDDKEINLKWLGLALKRLNLIVDKKRKNQGVEYYFNVEKAKNKLKIFKKEE